MGLILPPLKSAIKFSFNSMEFQGAEPISTSHDMNSHLIQMVLSCLVTQDKNLVDFSCERPLNHSIFLPWSIPERQHNKLAFTIQQNLLSI